jgi:hypothetical protein
MPQHNFGQSIKGLPITQHKCDACRETVAGKVFHMANGIIYCDECFKRLTCVTCDLRKTCRSAYDLYNLDGDCLESK